MNNLLSSAEGGRGGSGGGSGTRFISPGVYAMQVDHSKFDTGYATLQEVTPTYAQYSTAGSVLAKSVGLSGKDSVRPQASYVSAASLLRRA